MVIVNGIKGAVREELAHMDYSEIQTPTMLSDELWKISGHWDHYRENMYFSEVEGQNFAIKPMNCPGACLVYRSRRHSYRELPIRYAEFGHVHRHELSGVLHGLFRVRAFTQDDAHVFCRLDQVQDEVRAVLDLTDRFYGRFGFEQGRSLALHPAREGRRDAPRCGTRPSRRCATPWATATYGIKEGDGAFYGPKIDFQVTDVMGRSWQLGTCQLDFNFPERFDLTYTSADDTEERPVMIHRAITGSIERFLGILIENTGGDFPLWLAPEQARVLPVADRHAPVRRVGARPAARGRPARRGGRAQRVGGPAHPRRRALQGALPADRRRQGGAGRHRLGARPPRRRPRRHAPRRAGRPPDHGSSGLGRP